MDESCPHMSESCSIGMHSGPQEQEINWSLLSCHINEWMSHVPIWASHDLLMWGHDSSIWLNEWVMSPYEQVAYKCTVDLRHRNVIDDDFRCHVTYMNEWVMSLYHAYARIYELCFYMMRMNVPWIAGTGAYLTRPLTDTSHTGMGESWNEWVMSLYDAYECTVYRRLGSIIDTYSHRHVTYMNGWVMEWMSHVSIWREWMFRES